MWRKHHHDFTWIQTQLTLARWYLDAAASAATERVHHHSQQARNVYEATVRSLSRLSLDEQQRNLVARELSALRVQLYPDRTESAIAGRQSASSTAGSTRTGEMCKKNS